MATFVQDNIILLDNSRIKNSIPQGMGIPLVGSSFDFSSNYSYSGQGSSNMSILNSSSPFVIKLNGVLQGPWASLVAAGDGQYHEMIRFKNGNYITAMHDPTQSGYNANYINFRFYYSNGSLIQSYGSPLLLSSVKDSGFTVIDYGNNSYAFARYGSESNQGGFYHSLSKAINSTIFITTECIKPMISWKSIKSLTLPSPSEIGIPGVPIIQDTNQKNMLLSYIPDDKLNEGEPVTDGTDFVIKDPSLDNYIGQYNDTSYTSKNIFLENGNYVIIGRKSVGVNSSQYKFTFKSKITVSPQITYCEVVVTTSLLLDGSPYLGFIISDDGTLARLNLIFLKTSVDPSTGIKTRTVDYNTITMSDTDMNSLRIWLNDGYSFDTSSDEGMENPTHGGNETDDVINIPLNRPTLPTRGAVGSGFVKVYEVGDTELQDICEFMWDDSLLTNLGRFFRDPREIIVGLMVFPITPLHSTANSPIYAGNLDTGVTGNLLTNEYETRYAGSRRVPKGNNDFMSFAPYRRIKINIPYCGEHELDPSAVFGATLKLYYHLSFFSGNCIAEVTRTFDGGDEEPIAFYGGQMGYTIPLSSEDFTRTLSSLISAGVTIGTALCTYGASSAAAATSKKAAVAAARQGSANAALTGSIAGAAGGLLNGSLAPNVSYNSGGGANSGFLGCQQPYLIIDEPITAYDGNQSSYIGYTSYQTKKLSDCVGYTKCLEAHIEGVHASDSELEEIMSWLTNGVLIHQDGSATPSTTPTVAGNTVITMMKLTSERNVIGKKWIDATQIEGQLIYDQSITSPSVLVNGNSINFNYAYIGLFNRFYFVSDVIVRNKDLIEVKLKSDPLQSFKDEILNCYASVDRQKHNGNKFIDDPYMWTQVNNNVKILPFMDDGIEFDFGHTEDSYILTIAGKG